MHGNRSACRQYIVAIPGVIESGTQAKFCASLLKLNQAVDMTVVLKYGDKNMTLFEKASDKKFHECAEFQVRLWGYLFIFFHEAESVSMSALNIFTFFCYRHPQCRMKRCICWKYRCKVIHFTPKNPRRLWSKPFSRNRLSKQINQFIFPDRQVNTFKFIRFLFYLKECVHFMVLSYFSIIKITRYLVVISFFYCHLNAELFSHLFFSSKFQSFCIGR